MSSEKKKEKKPSLFSKFLGFIILMASFFVIALIITGFLAGDETSELLDVNNMTDPYFIYIFGAMLLISLAFWLSKLTKPKKNKDSGAKSETKGVIGLA